METTTASSTFFSALALPRIPTPSPAATPVAEPQNAITGCESNGGSNGATASNIVTSHLENWSVLDFGPKSGLFYARVQSNTQEVLKLKIYLDSSPARTVMMSVGENTVELRGYVPSNVVGTVKVSIQAFRDDEIFDSAPLGIFNVKDLKGDATSSLSSTLGKRAKECEDDGRIAKRPSVLSGNQWDLDSTPVTPAAEQQCEQADIRSPVNFEMDGDLASMATNWSHEEYHAHRRLVRFWRQQNGASLRISFAPIKQEEYTSGTIAISCIHCPENDECYFTSVDIIYLLEAFIGTQFSIEEKNRIRRNVEGFKPTTISKTSSEQSDFFNLIMSFPQPRPRNIEKDVKVFPWRSLTRAVEKIIGKYIYSSATGRIIEEKGSSYYARSPRRSQTSYFSSPLNLRSSVFGGSASSCSSSSISSPDTPLITPPLFPSDYCQQNPDVIEDLASVQKSIFDSITDPKNIVPFVSTDASCPSGSFDPLATLDRNFDLSYFTQLPMTDFGALLLTSDDAQTTLSSFNSACAPSSSAHSLSEEEFSALLNSLTTPIDFNEPLNPILLESTGSQVSSDANSKDDLIASDHTLSAALSFGDLCAGQNALQLSLSGDDLSGWDFSDFLC